MIVLPPPQPQLPLPMPLPLPPLLQKTRTPATLAVTGSLPNLRDGVDQGGTRCDTAGRPICTETGETVETNRGRARGLHRRWIPERSHSWAGETSRCGRFVLGSSFLLPGLWRLCYLFRASLTWTSRLICRLRILRFMLACTTSSNGATTMLAGGGILIDGWFLWGLLLLPLLYVFVTTLSESPYNAC